MITNLTPTITTGSACESPSHGDDAPPATVQISYAVAGDMVIAAHLCADCAADVRCWPPA